MWYLGGEGRREDKWCRGKSLQSLETEHDKDAEVPCEAGRVEAPGRQQDMEVQVQLWLQESHI